MRKVARDGGWSTESHYRAVTSAHYVRSRTQPRCGRRLGVARGAARVGTRTPLPFLIVCCLLRLHAALQPPLVPLKWQNNERKRKRKEGSRKDMLGSKQSEGHRIAVEHACMFTAAQPVTAKSWEQPLCPSTDEQKKGKGRLHKVEYYAVTKR